MADAAADTDPVDTQDKEDATVDLYELERVRSVALCGCMCVCAHATRAFLFQWFLVESQCASSYVGLVRILVMRSPTERVT
jgi:hypothetical protein